MSINREQNALDSRIEYCGMAHKNRRQTWIQIRFDPPGALKIEVAADAKHGCIMLRDKGKIRGGYGLRSNILLLLLAVTSYGPSLTLLHADEYSQVSHHSARLFSTGTLVINSRVGDLHIDGWDEPRVEIEAEKVVRAGSEAKAKPLYSQIQVRLEGGDQEVRLTTLYPSRKLWRPFRNESKLSVNFRIRMPFDSNLKLKCVDGDVTIAGIVGHEELMVNYGDVEIDVPHLYDLRSLSAHAWLGYVQSDLQGLSSDSAGLGQRISFWNANGRQNIDVKVRMGGVFIYREAD